MPLILRIDCDNGYAPFGVPPISKLRLALNYMNENYWAPHLRVLGYLRHLEVLLEYLHDVGANYSLFFKYTTIAPIDLVEEIIKHRNEIGLHLYSARTYNEFLWELGVIQRKMRVRVKGFTKHGDGHKKLSRKHAWRYEPEKYIEWGRQAGLQYFNGNIHGVEASIESSGGFIHIPQVFYIEPHHRYVKATINDVADHVLSGGTTVALVHPWNWFMYHEVRDELERLLSLVNKTITLDMYVKTLNRESMRGT